MKSYRIYAATVVVVAILLLYFSEPVAQWLAQSILGRNANSTEIARLVGLDGTAKRISSGKETVLKSPLARSETLSHGDRLEFNPSASGTLVLNSQDELKVIGGTSVVIQLWDPKDLQSPIYITLLQGNLALLRPGVRGRAYIVSDGRLYLPGQAPQSTRTPLVLNKTELDLSMSENQLEDTSDIEPTEKDLEVVEGGPTPETLSNEYIDETIVRRQVQLQKCWLTRVKDNPVQKGKMLVQLEINRRGKVKDVKIIDSDIDDSTLQNCVVGVLERISFRSYKGAEISLSYPILFE